MYVINFPKLSLEIFSLVPSANVSLKNFAPESVCLLQNKSHYSLRDIINHALPVHTTILLLLLTCPQYSYLFSSKNQGKHC